MIDKMFAQEILNAQLRKKYYINFLFYDCFPICLQNILLYFNLSIEIFLPRGYKIHPIQGTLLEEILNIKNGICDEELKHYNNNYKIFKKNLKKNDYNLNIGKNIKKIFSFEHD